MPSFASTDETIPRKRKPQYINPPCQAELFGAVTTGYESRKDGVVISPYLGLHGSSGTLDGFTEVGGGIYGVTYGDQDVSSFSGVVGVRVEKEIERDWGTLTPSARIEYRRDFVGDSAVSIGYTDVGDLPYRAEIKERGKDSVTVGIGLKAKPKRRHAFRHLRHREAHGSYRRPRHI